MWTTTPVDGPGAPRSATSPTVAAATDTSSSHGGERFRETLADRTHDDAVEPLGLRREEGRDLVVEERQAARPQAARVRGEVEPSEGDAALELRDAVAPVPEPVERRVEVGHQEDRCGTVGGQT